MWVCERKLCVFPSCHLLTFIFFLSPGQAATKTFWLVLLFRFCNFNNLNKFGMWRLGVCSGHVRVHKYWLFIENFYHFALLRKFANTHCWTLLSNDASSVWNCFRCPDLLLICERLAMHLINNICLLARRLQNQKVPWQISFNFTYHFL